MNVRMWMTRNVVTLDPNATLSEAAGLMARRRIRRLLVVSRGSIEGIVTLFDLARAMPPDVNPLAVPDAFRSARRVSDVMTPRPLSVNGETLLEEAALLMRERKIGGLPVVDQGVLTGIITESDVLRALARVIGAGEAGVRVTFDISAGEDVVRWIVDLAQRQHLQVASVLTFYDADRPLASVRVRGASTEAFVEAVWSSGHRVINVARLASR